MMAYRCANCEKMIHAADLAFCEGAYVHDRCADDYRKALATGRKLRAAPPDPKTVAEGKAMASGSVSTSPKFKLKVKPRTNVAFKVGDVEIEIEKQPRRPRYDWNGCRQSDAVQQWFAKNKDSLFERGKLAEFERVISEWFDLNNKKCPGEVQIREKAREWRDA